MRVITGSARGTSLKTLEGDTTRPTSEKVKEAIFSALQFELEGRRILDLFAGSGQMGIEALSRGAESAIFVDSDKNAVKIIKENLEKTKLSDQAQVFQGDSLAFLSMTGKIFDIVFVDPPYQTGLLQKAADKLASRVAEGGAVVFEHPFTEELPECFGDLIKQKDYKYGKIAVSIFRKG